MLRKFAKALDNRHERKSLDRLAASFNDQMQAYLSGDFLVQVGAEMSLRTTYHAFITRYPEISNFLNTEHSAKSDYINKISNFVQIISKEEKAGNVPQGVTIGTVLVQFWITALAWGDFELADEMSAQLEPLNRSAYETDCATGKAKPDDKCIAEWKEIFGNNIDPYSLMD